MCDGRDWAGVSGKKWTHWRHRIGRRRRNIRADQVQNTDQQEHRTARTPKNVIFKFDSYLILFQSTFISPSQKKIKKLKTRRNFTRRESCRRSVMIVSLRTRLNRKYFCPQRLKLDPLQLRLAISVALASSSSSSS